MWVAGPKRYVPHEYLIVVGTCNMRNRLQITLSLTTLRRWRAVGGDLPPGRAQRDHGHRTRPPPSVATGDPDWRNGYRSAARLGSTVKAVRVRQAGDFRLRNDLAKRALTRRFDCGPKWTCTTDLCPIRPFSLVALTINIHRQLPKSCVTRQDAGIGTGHRL